MESARRVSVLVVDDDTRARTVVAWQLEEDGYVVSESADGSDALAQIERNRPDVVVLDLTLPGLSGLDVLRRVRAAENATQRLPVIVLSGRSSETDRIVGLDLGADDYLVKPFSPAELAARVRSLLRRTSRDADREQPADGLWIDESSRKASLNGRPLEFTAKEFDLLMFLDRHRGQVFTRAQLLDRVWGSGHGWQSEATVTEHIHRLRKKIEPRDGGPGRVLTTVRGVGYRLEASDATA